MVATPRQHPRNPDERRAFADAGSARLDWGRSERMLPIPGFRTVAQVEENAGALAFGPLSAAQIAEIDTILGRA